MSSSAMWYKNGNFYEVPTTHIDFFLQNPELLGFTQEEKEQQNQPQQPQEDKEKMEQMLKALMQDEKEIREKMEETEKAKAKRGIPEKNW